MVAIAFATRVIGEKLGGPQALASYSTSPNMICPHCQQKGRVETRPTKIKTGLGGGKVNAAALTLGVSAITPGIGLSNKQSVTEAHCKHCNSTWRF